MTGTQSFIPVTSQHSTTHTPQEFDLRSCDCNRRVVCFACVSLSSPQARHCGHTWPVQLSLSHTHTQPSTQLLQRQHTPHPDTPTMSSSDLDHVRALQLVQQRKRECLNYAVLDGLTSAGISLAVAAGLSWSLQKSSDVSCCVRLCVRTRVGMMGIGSVGRGCKCVLSTPLTPPNHPTTLPHCRQCTPLPRLLLSSSAATSL